MADIIPLVQPEREVQIWVCGCGSKHFELRDDGTIECALCNKVSSPGNWHEMVEPDMLVQPKATREIYAHSSAEFARRSIMRNVGEETSALIVIQKDGTIKAWHENGGGGATPDERAWLLRKMQSAFNLIFGIPDEKETNDVLR